MKKEDFIREIEGLAVLASQSSDREIQLSGVVLLTLSSALKAGPTHHEALVDSVMVVARNQRDALMIPAT